MKNPLGRRKPLFEKGSLNGRKKRSRMKRSFYRVFFYRTGQLILVVVAIACVLWDLEEGISSRDLVPSSRSLRRRIHQTQKTVAGKPLYPPYQEMIPYQEAERHERYCYWQPDKDTLQECYNLLSPVLQNKRRWTMLGDSTMRKHYLCCNN